MALWPEEIDQCQSHAASISLLSVIALITSATIELTAATFL